MSHSVPPNELEMKTAFVKARSSVIKVSEIHPESPKTEAYELKTDAKYLIVINDPNASMYHLKQVHDYLKAHGVDCVVVPALDIKLFQIER